MARMTKKQETEKAIISLVLNYGYTMEQIRLVNNGDVKALATNEEWEEKHKVSYTDYLREDLNTTINKLKELGYNEVAETFNYF
jgi:hypothetical protein